MSAIELRGGLLVQEDAIALALALESAGITLTVTDGVLTASPRSALTPAQIAAIRAMKFQLMAVAGYDADAVGPSAS